MNLTDPIVAISSAVAPAARLIVRLSGPGAIDQLQSIALAANTEGASASHTVLRFADLEVPAWVYVFRAPRSYTGDDLIEFHLPGNVLLARMLVDELTKHGARGAEPGEFTARAFLNGRLDLTAAEGVALAIHAQHADELKAARQLMAGELSRRLLPIMESLVATLALVEAGIDFAEEDISFISTVDLHSRLQTMLDDLNDLTDNTARFERLSHEPTFVLVGRPNAGKSTLLNALSGKDRAVVSPVAGTTRDVLSTAVDLPHGRAIVIDVAGLEPVMEDEPVRRSIAEQMQERARRTVEEADFVIHVIDGTYAAPPLDLPRAAEIVVSNKHDTAISGLPPLEGGIKGGVLDFESARRSSIPPTPPSPSRGEGEIQNADPDSISPILLSAKTGANLDQLRARMNALAFGRSTASSALALNARHVVAIEEAQQSIRVAIDQTNPVAEMIAHELRHALDAIGQVLGQVTPDDVLGKIFAGFCIGK